MQAFLSKYKVFLTGLVGAIILAIVNLDSSNGLTWQALIMPILVAISSYVATSLRGQWTSIAGIGFTVLIGFVQAKLSHEPYVFDAKQLQWILGQLAVLYFGYNAPPFKARTYEHDATIEQAKTNPDLNTPKSFYKGRR
jgi:uncharacterized membrane protein YjdF